MTTLPELQQFLLSLEPLVLNADSNHQQLIKTFVNAKQIAFDPNFSATLNVDQFIAVQAGLWAAAGQRAVGAYQTLGIIPPK